MLQIDPMVLIISLRLKSRNCTNAGKNKKFLHVLI
jgi:hypothetical protein